MRDHDPVILEEFNGWWQKGDIDTCPIDHFTECINMKFIQGGFTTRNGVDKWWNYQNVVRAYTYNVSSQGTLALLSNGHFYHIYGNPPSFYDILTIASAVDFKFVNINGRAYITPLATGGEALGGSFVYVYNGDGTAARKIGGIGPVDADGALAAANSATAGKVELGYHVFGVIYETNSGFLSQIGPTTLASVNAPGGKKVDLTVVPVSPSSAVTKRHIVATKAILPANWIGDTKGYQFFYVPGGEISNNTATTKTVDFYDSELIDDASHLLDLFTEIPACNDLDVYHNRLVCAGISGFRNIAYVSYPDEPEAIDQVSGLVILPDNGLPILTAFHYRDVLYLSKIGSTAAINDNNDDPSNWPVAVIDEGEGCATHGKCIISINQGGVNVEFVVLMNWAGLWTFNGLFQKPELTWKIQDYWLGLSKDQIKVLYQVYNDPLLNYLYVFMPDLNTILVGDYKNGLDAKAIKWSKWIYGETLKTISIFDNDNKLLITTSSWIYYDKVGQTNDNWNAGAQKIPDPTIVTALIGD